MSTDLESPVLKFLERGPSPRQALLSTGSSNKMPIIRQPLFSPVSQEYLRRVRKGGHAFHARQPSSPVTPPTTCREAEEEGMVAFLTARTGLQEVAVATFHLDLAYRGPQNGLAPLDHPLSALEADLEATIWEVQPSL